MCPHPRLKRKRSTSRFAYASASDRFISHPSDRGGVLMEKTAVDGLKALIEQGKEKGFLTYDQVNDHLPDDDTNPEKIDQILILLEDQGIELIEEAEAEEREGGGGPVLDDETRAELDLSFMDEEES